MNKTDEYKHQYTRLQKVMETAANQAYFDKQVIVNGIYIYLDFLGNTHWRTRDKRKVSITKMEERHAKSSLQYAERKMQEIKDKYMEHANPDFYQFESRLGFWLYWHKLFEIRVAEINKNRVASLFNEAEGNDKYNDFLDNLNV